MVRQAKKEVLSQLFQRYRACAQGNDAALYEIAMSELPEMVYHSNAIENSTLTLHETEAIIMRDIITKDHEIREVFEAKNLAYVMTQLLNKPPEKLTTELLLSLHALLMAGIRHDIAGRFRSGNQWVRVGSHVGANPAFVPGLIAELLREYDQCDDEYFLDAIARFHAEFELIHPFLDGNGRIGRVIINQQLMQKGYPPIIIQSKHKHRDYYPLFDVYERTNRCDGFADLFALLLQESLHKRIALLSSRRVITVAQWAKRHGIAGNTAANKAARQTIPAFRMRGVWMIGDDTA